MDGSFFRGASASQDDRFSDKTKKLMGQMKFPACFDQKLDMEKVNFGSVKPWIAQNVTELLGFEDEVLIEYVFSMFEHKVDGKDYPDPKVIQINLIPFLEKKTSGFMTELWEMLLSAQDSVGGVPETLMKAKLEEIKAEKAAKERIGDELRRRRERIEEELGKDKRSGSPAHTESSRSREESGEGNETSRRGESHIRSSISVHHRLHRHDRSNEYEPYERKYAREDDSRRSHSHRHRSREDRHRSRSDRHSDRHERDYHHRVRRE